MLCLTSPNNLNRMLSNERIPGTGHRLEEMDQLIDILINTFHENFDNNAPQ